MAVEFGLALTPGPLKGAISNWLDDYVAVLPELEGHFASLWMPDHFFWNDMPTYEAMTVLTYLAGKHPAFSIGSSVLGQTYRNPALLAKMAATLQTLSGGRFILGMGAGWKEDEHHAYDFPYPSAKVRLEQLEDTLQIIKMMWETPGPVSFEGRHYRIKDAYCEPRPDPRPIIMVGGGSNTTIQHAARHADWWNLSDSSHEVFEERLHILRSHCSKIGRDIATIRKTVFARLVLGDSKSEALERAHRQGRSHYGGWTIEGAFVGTPNQVVEQLGAFIESGVDYFIVEVLDIDLSTIRSMLVEEVIPNVAVRGSRQS